MMIPNYAQLIEYTFKALKELGGSGKNNAEPILNQLHRGNIPR